MRRLFLAPSVLLAVAACGTTTPRTDAPALVIEDSGSVFSSIEIAQEAMDAEDLGVTSANRLVTAATANDLDEVRALIEAGADVNERNWRGTTALGAAAFYGYLEIARALLEAGANPNVGSSITWPLMSALSENHKDIFAALLEVGAETDQSDFKGRTPLMLAARDGQVEMARMLIENGADVDAVSIEEPPRNPLLNALRTGNIAIAHMLLEAGASTAMPDGSPGSALDTAREAHAQLSKFLGELDR